MYKLKDEEKAIVLANNFNNKLVQEMDEILGGVLKNVVTKPFTTIYTLGKLKTEKIYVVNYEMLSKESKLQKIYDAIAMIDEDCVVSICSTSQSTSILGAYDIYRM